MFSLAPSKVLKVKTNRIKFRFFKSFNWHYKFSSTHNQLFLLFLVLTHLKVSLDHPQFGTSSLPFHFLHHLSQYPPCCLSSFKTSTRISTTLEISIPTPSTKGFSTSRTAKNLKKKRNQSLSNYLQNECNLVFVALAV